MGSKSNNNQSDNPLYDFFFYMFIFGLSLSSTLFGNLKASFTLAILVLVWLTDVALKKLAGIRNSTLYADLCFAALVLLSTSIPNKVIGSFQQSGEEIIIKLSFADWFWLCISIFGLLFLWLMNIRLCRFIEKEEASRLTPDVSWLKWWSAILAFSSTIIVFLALGRGVL